MQTRKVSRLGGVCRGVVETSFRLDGSFQKLGVPFVGVLIIRILLLGCYIRIPYFRQLPDEGLHGHQGDSHGCFYFEALQGRNIGSRDRGNPKSKKADFLNPWSRRNGLFEKLLPLPVGRRSGLAWCRM